MAHDDLSPTDRRTFLQAGALVTASAASLSAGASAQDAAPALPATLPKRPLGKTGMQISLLDIGTGKGRGVGRLLRYAYSQGIRAFDTSAAYQSEPDFNAWFQQEPAVRKEIFIVTKEHEAPAIAGQLRRMIDARCAAMGTDYIDLFFVHSFGYNERRVASAPQEQGTEAGSRRGQEVRQAQAVWAVDPPQRPGRDPPNGGRGGIYRRDHGSIFPLARQAVRAEQGARRLP